PAQRSLASPVHVWLVDTSGQAPPVACSALGVDSDDFGPQWVEGGTKLVFTHASRELGQESIQIADIAGGRCSNLRTLLGGDSQTRYVAPANAAMACASGRPTSAPSAPARLLALLGVVLAHRRARHRREANTST